MNIILCEGKTDAVLISHFLIKCYGYNYLNTYKVKPPIKLPMQSDNQHIFWYKNNKNIYTACWAVGGFENIINCFFEVIDRTRGERIPENRINKVIICFDRDNRSDEDILKTIGEWLLKTKFNIEDEIITGSWLKGDIEFEKSPPEKFEIDIFFMSIPPDNEGALETFLLDSLSKLGSIEKLVIDRARSFIEEIPDDPFLKKKRFREKAVLGSALSTFSPDCVFDVIDNRLRSLNWETVKEINKLFMNFDSLLS